MPRRHLVRTLDVAIIRNERMPNGELPTGYFPGAADVAIIVVTPDDKFDEVAACVRAISMVYSARLCRLETLTLNLTQREDVALIDTAEWLYAREKSLAVWRQADGLAARLPRMQAFARGLTWLTIRNGIAGSHAACSTIAS